MDTNQLYQVVVNNLEDYIYIVDQNGKNIFTNHPEKKITLTAYSNEIWKDEENHLFQKKEIIIPGTGYIICQYHENTTLYEEILKLETDSITGLKNRLMIDRYLEAIGTNKEKQKISYIIAMLDIDYFKRVNDTYGHIYGDQILAEFSSLLKSKFNQEDFIGRYGGEEMIVVLKNKKIEYAIRSFEEFRQEVESYFQNGLEKLTVSIGLSNDDTYTPILNKLYEADKALYYVKENGRNNVAYYGYLGTEYHLTKPQIKQGYQKIKE